MSDDVIARLRALAAALPEPIKGYEQLERAGDLLLRRQELLSDRWDRDVDLLRAQAKAVRGLRHEMSGLARVTGRAGMANRGPLTGRRGSRRSLPAIAGRARGSGRSAVSQRGAMARAGAAGARAYARTFARRLSQAPALRRAGRTAGRALTASTAATAAAQTARSFRARERRWALVGAATGATIGAAAGPRAANVTALKTAVSLFGELRKVDTLVRAAGTITGNTFGTQAGSQASISFAANFHPITPFSVGGGGGGGGGIGGFLGGMLPGPLGGLLGGGGGLPGPLGGMLGVGLPNLGDAANGAGSLAGSAFDLVSPLGGLGDKSLDMLSGAAGGMDNVAGWLGGGSKLTWGLNATNSALGALGWVDYYGTAKDFFGGRASLYDFLNETGKQWPGAAGWVFEGNEIFGKMMNQIQGRDPGPGGFLGDMMSDFSYQSRRWMNGLGHRARGGVVRHGEVTVVGERGPELVQLPAIATATSGQPVREALERAAGTPAAGRPRRRRDLHVHQVLDGRRIARAAIRNIDNDLQWGRR